MRLSDSNTSFSVRYLPSLPGEGGRAGGWKDRGTVCAVLCCACVEGGHKRLKHLLQRQALAVPASGVGCNICSNGVPASPATTALPILLLQFDTHTHAPEDDHLVRLLFELGLDEPQQVLLVHASRVVHVRVHLRRRRGARGGRLAAGWMGMRGRGWGLRWGWGVAVRCKHARRALVPLHFQTRVKRRQVENISPAERTNHLADVVEVAVRRRLLGQELLVCEKSGRFESWWVRGWWRLWIRKHKPSHRDTTSPRSPHAKKSHPHTCPPHPLHLHWT